MKSFKFRCKNVDKKVFWANEILDIMTNKIKKKKFVNSFKEELIWVVNNCKGKFKENKLIIKQ